MTRKKLSLRRAGLALILAGLLLILIIGTALAATATLLNDNFQGTPYDANWDNTDWLESTRTGCDAESIYAQGSASGDDDGFLTTYDLDTSDATSITVEFWYRDVRTESNDFTLYYYDGANYDLIADLGNTDPGSTWRQYSHTITDSQYFISNFRIRFDAQLLLGDDGGEYVHVDCVLITKEVPGYSFTMAENTTDCGTTDPAVGAHAYEEDEVVPVSATAYAGCVFDNWTGDLSGSTNPTSITMDSDKSVTVNFSTIPTAFLVDGDFDASADSADLRFDSAGQDWYESRDDDPTLLTLDESTIGANSSKKAALMNYDTASNVYVTQAFGTAQTSIFAVSFDIYIDRIFDDSTYDRSAFIFIGNDSIVTNGPTGTSNERFAFLTFYDSDPDSGDDDLEIRAREDGTGGQPWADTSTWTVVATGLSYDTWYSIKILVNVPGDSYDVYVDDVLQGNITKYSGYSSNSVEYISFSGGNVARGDFYVDNIQEDGEMQCFSTTGTYTFNTQSGVEIEVTDIGSGGTELGCLFVDDVPANHPNATGTEGSAGIMTGKYWTIHGLQSDGSTPATGYTLNLTLPHSVTPDTNAYVCKYPGSQGGYGWDCARTDSDASTVWLNGITSLSDWAIGDNVGPTAIVLQDLTAYSSSPVRNLALVGLTLLGIMVVSSVSLAVYRKRRS